MSENSIRGIEQGRAKFAYDRVKVVADPGTDVKKQKKYKSGAKKLPILIKTNGLGQALAFINKRDDGNIELYKMISDWLSHKQLIELSRRDELVEVVIDATSNEYRQLTNETLALLNWVRRFVDSLMKDVEDED